MKELRNRCRSTVPRTFHETTSAEELGRAGQDQFVYPPLAEPFWSVAVNRLRKALMWIFLSSRQSSR